MIPGPLTEDEWMPDGFYSHAEQQGDDHDEGLLDAVRAFLSRFIAYPSDEAAVAHTLWVAHAHFVDAFENTPRLAFLSPEPGSGKSRAMELTEALVPRPVLSVNASVAYIFRKISDEAGLPTLLMDEIDAVFSSGKAEVHEDLRGLLNSGYRKGATAGRAAIRGREIVTEEWPSFCAVALAGLNQLPDTLMTRSIVIPMKRRRPGQKIEPYRRRVFASEAGRLRNRLARFAESARAEVAGVWPDLPEGIEDRDADIWEPLLSVADAAGGRWPETAREAALVMVAKAKEKPATLGIRLLADIRDVLDGRDRISTTDLLGALDAIDTAPWASIKGEPIDARYLARMLGRYEIPTNNTVRIDGGTVKGYLRAHFADAFQRYLPAVTAVTAVTDVETQACAEPEQRYLHLDSGVGGEQVIRNKQGVIRNKQPESPYARLSPEVGNSGNAGNGVNDSTPACAVCGFPMHPALTAAGTHPSC
ncbi:DUF3631 domain-containing protein [Arthrobacter sp.]|uniref:DUF3631 domain-containing protein n=1 Tax=Arthrobacter sp. TaxID=1667 RepID=UPI002811C0E2|nr:DUF3631 domain-containing protein [Arthrobacter sp.]